MTTKQSQPTPTPEEVWAILKENARQMKENSRELTEKFAETDRQMKATDRQMKETDQRLDKKFAETDREFKEIGKLLKQSHNLFTTQWGKLMESLVEGDLIKLLNQKGINIKETYKNQVGERRYTDEHGIEQAKPCEIDIIAKNGEEVVVVEVKTTLRVEDVKKFLDILPNFTRYLPQYSGKKVYGAVAYLQAKASSEIYAEKKGLFVIRATGNSASIINAEGFKAKVFG